MKEICGLKQSESYGYYDQNTASLKTFQVSLIQDTSAESLKTFTKHGMMLNGVLSELMMSDRHTGENDCGFWPTPTKCGNYNKKGASKTSGDGLATVVKKFPTPRVFMHKDSKTDRGKGNLGEVIGGALNPNWVEWLMGWHPGWTDLKPLETAKFQQWLDSHGKH